MAKASHWPCGNAEYSASDAATAITATSRNVARATQQRAVTFDDGSGNAEGAAEAARKRIQAAAPSAIQSSASSPTKTRPNGKPRNTAHVVVSAERPIPTPNETASASRPDRTARRRSQARSASHTAAIGSAKPMSAGITACA
jgi:hypothetical protein